MSSDLSSNTVSVVEPVPVVEESLFTGKLSWPFPVTECLMIVAKLELTVKDKTDAEKLVMLQTFLKKELSSSEISEEEKTTATRFVDETLPHVVQAVLVVSKGQVSLKVVETQVVEAVKEKVAELAEPAAAVLATVEGKLAQVVGTAKVEEWKKEVVAVVPASWWGCWPKQVKTTIVPPPTPTVSTVSV